jgi:spermidine synthase
VITNDDLATDAPSLAIEKRKSAHMKDNEGPDVSSKIPPFDEHAADVSDRPDLWFHEFLTPFDAYHHGVREVICSKQTPFQSLTIADTGTYGRALFLDGKIQTAAGDERHYHEPMVHGPAVASGGAPTSFLVLGGADGAAVREALRWSTTQRVTLVDIDRAVINACQEHLPGIHCGALQDPRVELVVDDAAVFIAQRGNGRPPYDVVICDLTDPMENSPSLALFTVEFFRSLKLLLSSPRAAVSLQAGPASLVENPSLFPRVCATLRAAFEHVHPCQLFAPTYGSPLGMAVASDMSIDLPAPSTLDTLFKEQLAPGHELEVLDGAAFHAMFGIPRYLTAAIEAENRVFTASDMANAFGQGTLNQIPNNTQPL